MTKAKAIYQECYKFKEIEYLPKEILKYSKKECPICKENDINANYRFCISTYKDYLNNTELQILPFCSECMDSGYLYSMSKDKIIYFTCKDDKHLHMIHMPDFLLIRGKVIKTPIDDWGVIRIRNSETKEVKYIKKFSWIEQQLIPCFHVPPELPDTLPINYREINKPKYVYTPPPLPPPVIKQFKIYQELRQLIKN